MENFLGHLRLQHGGARQRGTTPPILRFPYHHLQWPSSHSSFPRTSDYYHSSHTVHDSHTCALAGMAKVLYD